MINVIRLTFNLILGGTRSYVRNNNYLPVINRVYNSFGNRPLLNSYFIRKLAYKKKKMPIPSAIVLLAEGAEEIEFVTIVDVLRRGNVKVTIAGVLGEDPVKCRCETLITPDISLVCALCQTYDAVVIPGGLGGSKVISESEPVGKLLKRQEQNEGIIAAICAGPTALKAHGIAKGKNVTSYPAMAEEMRKDDLYKYHDKKAVVVDRNVITSRGPATAMSFAFSILTKLQGEELAREVAQAMLFNYCECKV